MRIKSLDRREFGAISISAVSSVVLPALSTSLGLGLFDLKLFRATLPDGVAYVEHGPMKHYGIHACYWKPGTFSSHREFTQFTLAFSSILQPYITLPHVEQVEDWFRHDTDLDNRLAKKWSAKAITRSDAHAWTSNHYPGVRIPWLLPRSFSRLLIADDDECVEVFAYGPAGFHHAFTADACF
jgi:hypothetical protein